MLSLLKRFFLNEWKGIKQIGQKLSRSFVLSESEEITKDRFPQQYEVISEISVQAKVYPSKTLVTSYTKDSSASASPNKKITIGRADIRNKVVFVGTYAHELGHVKYNKFHNVLTFTNIPYKLLMFTTSALYFYGSLSYPFLGNNSAINGGNYLLEHTGKYLIAGAIINTATTRLREHMADIFAYKHTGVLPTDYLDNGYRHGIVGNISEIISEVVGKITSGYPTNLERDFVAKFLSKPKKTSFVEQLKSERHASNITQQQKSPE